MRDAPGELLADGFMGGQLPQIVIATDVRGAALLCATSNFSALLTAHAWSLRANAATLP